MTLTTPAGNSGFLERRHQGQHRERRVGRRLEHDRTAGRERRADLARRHRRGEIPRRHQHGDAGRLVVHENSRSRGRRARHFADIAHGLFRIPAEELRGIGHLAARIRQRLSVLKRDQLREAFGVAHDQLVGLAQDFRALARLASRPSLECALGSVERCLCIIDRGAGDRGDLALRRRIDHVETAAIGRLAPFAADPKVRRNIGEQVVVVSHVTLLNLSYCASA